MRDTSVMDQYWFNADPYMDLTFHSNVHPDQEPSFYFHVDTDPDPSPLQMTGIDNLWSVGPLGLYCERPEASMALFCQI